MIYHWNALRREYSRNDGWWTETELIIFMIARIFIIEFHSIPNEMIAQRMICFEISLEKYQKVIYSLSPSTSMNIGWNAIR